MTLLLAISCSGELARVRPPQPRVEWASIINLQKQKMPQSCSCAQREEQFQPLTSQWLELRWLSCGSDQITLLLLLSWNLFGIFPYFTGVQWKISNRTGPLHVWSTLIFQKCCITSVSEEFYILAVWILVTISKTAEWRGYYLCVSGNPDKTFLSFSLSLFPPSSFLPHPSLHIFHS